MADWSEQLKAVMLPFPCLWDPQDPYFLDKTVKAVCREQVLEIFNQRSDVSIDMESLKQWIANNLKQSTLTHQTTTEELPITTSPQGGQTVPSKVAESTAHEITATEKLPINTLPPGGQSVRSKNTESTAQEITATEKLPINTLPPGGQSVRSKNTESTAQEITATVKPPVTTSPQKRPRVRRKVARYKARREPKLCNLLKEFPCLWNREDLNNRDYTMRRRCLELLLQKYNRLSSTEITMADLRRKLIAFRKRLYRAKKCLPVVPVLDDLVKEFPCLWNRKDLNFKDKTMRRRCLELLLQKFNRLSSTEITMADLKRKLEAFMKRLYRVDNAKRKSSSSNSLLAHEVRNRKNDAQQGMPVLDDLVKEFPCLWNRKDLNYHDITMRGRCLELLLQKYNRLSSTEITMADLRRKMMAFRQRLYRGEKCLARRKSSSSKQTISLLAHVEKNQETDAQQGMPTLDELFKEFPCLWNRNDLNYRDLTMRRRCLELLLQKFNSLSSTEITMADLRRKLGALQTRLYRMKNAIGKSSQSNQVISLFAHLANQETVLPQGKPLYDLVKPYPCLWDPDDLNFWDKTIRARCEQELLQKFNKLSSIQINMADLKRKLSTLNMYRFRIKAKEAKRQTEVHEISEGYLGTNEEENEFQEIMADNLRVPDNSQTDPEASMDSTDTNQRPQDGPNQEAGPCLEVLFNYCRFCGELKISSDTNDIKHYEANNKCTLIINDLRAELELTDDILPRNVCKDCDKKFQEMVDFVKCVKAAQVKLNPFNNETVDRIRENEDLLAENEKADGQRKRCKITIDFNSDKLQLVSDNNDENNVIEMNNDYEIESVLEIDTESEQSNESNVPINNDSPSLSLHNENTNTIKSDCHRSETTKNITINADFLRNKPTNDIIYVNTRQRSKTHQNSTKDFEDDVNRIVMNIEDETAAKDINDIQKQPTADGTCDDDGKKIRNHKQLVMHRARKKAQLNNEM